MNPIDCPRCGKVLRLFVEKDYCDLREPPEHISLAAWKRGYSGSPATCAVYIMKHYIVKCWGCGYQEEISK